jgi:hypothetical protein
MEPVLLDDRTVAAYLRGGKHERAVVGWKPVSQDRWIVTTRRGRVYRSPILDGFEVRRFVDELIAAGVEPIYPSAPRS